MTYLFRRSPLEAHEKLRSCYFSRCRVRSFLVRSLLSKHAYLRSRFVSVPGFLKLPSDLYLGEVAGVAVNSKGHLFVFSRGSTTGPAYGASAAQLLEFGADGKFVREIGHNLYA